MQDMPEFPKKPSKTWRKPLFMDRLTPEQELLLVEMRDERNKAAPQLVSFDTVQHFKNTEGSEMKNYLQTSRSHQSTYSPTVHVATSAAVQRLRDDNKSNVEARNASRAQFVQSAIVQILIYNTVVGQKIT